MADEEILVAYGAQHVSHPPQHLDRWPGGAEATIDRRSRPVIITRGLGPDELESSLRAFQSLPEAAPG